MSKAERLPRWAHRRLTAEQREAYDRLRWHRLTPAEAARDKMVLGWKRTREETIALANELLSDGLLERVVAERLGVSDRYLRRLLTERQATTENAPSDPSVHEAEVALTCETDSGVPRRTPIRFASFRELDEWLGPA